VLVGLLVKALGIQVNAARPRDSPCLGVNIYLREEARVAQRLKDWSGVKKVRQVHIAGKPVIEREAQPVIIKHVEPDDVRDSGSHVLMISLNHPIRPGC
jgi:hypothetical protein